MILNILILVAGLALVVFGADWLVDGSSVIARKAKISEFVIGLTIVGFGTSCPELVVSLTGAINGSADISVGNVVGSNIFNTMLILGVTALLSPIAVSSSNRKVDIPLTLAVTVLLVVFGMNYTVLHIGVGDSLSRIEGVLFLLLFAAYMFFCFKTGKGESEDSEQNHKQMGVPMAILLILAGLGALIGGGRLFVDSAVSIARILGVSDKFIAITVLAGGTSLPELATCIVAAAKHKDQLALGNILGSNVFNILLILGLSATITPLSLAGMEVVDIIMLLLSVSLLFLFTQTGKRDTIDRWEGLVFLLLFGAYYAWMIAGI